MMVFDLFAIIPESAMSRPQAIVAATDFSASADRAARQAAFLARDWSATLTLVHVFNDSFWGSFRAGLGLAGWSGTSPEQLAQDRLEEQCEQIAQEFGVTVDSEVRFGRASLQIGEVVAARRAGLLAVGERGESWICSGVLGGTALKTLETTRIPVLLVRSAEPEPYRDIAIATDFSAAAERGACLALECFPEAKHTLIHTWQLPFENSMRLSGAGEGDIRHYRERELAKANARLMESARDCAQLPAYDRMERKPVYGSPAEVVLEQALANKNDLIVIGKHGGRLVNELILGSVTQNILYHAECDVLLSP